jgi:uncharacterized membrane protein YfcA
MLQAILIHALLCISAIGAGVINAIAGGGTLLTFPALLWALADRGAAAGVLANATSTVALVPGSLAGAWGFRRELAGTGPWLKLLFWPSLAGGLVGAWLLIVLPDSWFQIIIPWLLLIASGLFLLQPTLTRYLKTHPGGGLPSTAMCGLLVFFQFLVAIYGGYFGAGIGILMLSALSLMGMGDIHRMNAVKTLLAAVINGVSVVVFVASGKVEWVYAPVMAVAAIVGGYLGAHFGRRLPRALVRWTVILIGFGLAAYYFWKQAAVGSAA